MKKFVDPGFQNGSAVYGKREAIVADADCHVGNGIRVNGQVVVSKKTRLQANEEIIGNIPFDSAGFKLLFLKLVASSGNESFWEEHRDVAKSHTEQLKSKVHTVEQLLARLEACNFFRMTRDSENDFTLVLGSELPKKFVKIFLEEYFAGMGVKAEIKENLAKLRVTVKR
ncbi:MAG: hypothetical protein R3319_05245 [Candidatus Bathyarchaeia archaeon]|nr:hypothetical protein [Candidatus Bathyarchaeia archaeon]